MTIEEALAWCAENGAIVEFFRLYGTKRVKIKVPGHAVLAERDSFIEAVEAADRALTRRRVAAQAQKERDNTFL